jgi:TetR/AcrR family transcriptional regulator, transcriptional repressor of bet genes
LPQQTRKRARPHTQAEINEYRRQMLIESTITSLAERGVGGTTVRSICAGAENSRGLIGHYYASKEELVAEAFRHLFSSVSRQVQEAQSRMGSSALERLRATPRLQLSPAIFTERNRNAWLTFWHEIRFNPAVRAVNVESYRDYSRRTQALFAEAAEECGVIIDADSAAIGLMALIDGLWLERSIDGAAVSREKAIQLCLRYIDQQLGIAPPPERRRRTPPRPE